MQHQKWKRRLIILWRDCFFPNIITPPISAPKKHLKCLGCPHLDWSNWLSVRLYISCFSRNKVESLNSIHLKLCQLTKHKKSNCKNQQKGKVVRLMFETAYFGLCAETACPARAAYQYSGLLATVSFLSSCSCEST